MRHSIRREINTHTQAIFYMHAGLMCNSDTWMAILDDAVAPFKNRRKMEETKGYTFFLLQPIADF